MKQEIEVKNLDHLGIVAGIIDELGIEDLVNQALGTDKREKISAGIIVKAIILNGLGFVAKPLYLFPQFFADKPIEHLLGEGIKAEEINDDKIGRVMDDLYEYSLESLWTSLAINTINKYEIKTKYSHLDSSSVSVHGEYKINPKQEGENLEENRENVIEITYGYSRDKRPDLKQFMLDLMVSSDGDVPLLMRTGSGNESDKNIFPSIIKAYEKNLNLSTIYVTDSALYTAKNLHSLGGTKWLTRVPFSLKKAKEIAEKAKEAEFQSSEKKGYKYQEKPVNYQGIKQRWLIVESAARKDSDLEQLADKLTKEREKMEKQLKNWQQRKKLDLNELKLEVKKFNESLKYYQLEELKYQENLNNKKEKVYSCQGTIEEKAEIIKAETERAGRFILATNVLDSEQLSAAEMLHEYKAQQSCERGFRFIKDPLFLADTVFVKNPKRIETMGFLMGVCLLVYSLGQRMLRRELQKRGEKVKNQLGKATDKPTLRWIFQVLQGIHLVRIHGQSHLSNLTEEILDILQYFSIYCQNYYRVS
ncbi:MAG: IS1634 family transposase [Microcystis sp.]|jgi:transposase|uniref:IS1634 family transposase n=1 Tax=Microcystis sp. TaxID=1127 RepID=UPI00391A3672